ncbi:unnamed protein product [Durusdinium trenchii]|uniref:Uncharacterized protein n=1 Tax=Durusdinium trenchii TaxID=1381693 RepID=A0ABP0LKK4_9DINO
MAVWTIGLHPKRIKCDAAGLLSLSGRGDRRANQLVKQVPSSTQCGFAIRSIHSLRGSCPGGSSPAFPPTSPGSYPNLQIHWVLPPTDRTLVVYIIHFLLVMMRFMVHRDLPRKMKARCSLHFTV